MGSEEHRFCDEQQQKLQQKNQQLRMLQLEQSLQRDAVAFIMITPEKAKMMRRPDHEGSERKGGGQESLSCKERPSKDKNWRWKKERRNPKNKIPQTSR